MIGFEGGVLWENLIVSLPIRAMHECVRDRVNSGGSWELANLEGILGRNHSANIMAELPPSDGMGNDQIVRKLQSNGEFSVKSAYDSRLQHFQRNN